MINTIRTILYVSNQQVSTQFYQKLLDIAPALNVPGMTEFELSKGTYLGLMPESGIKSLLGDPLPNPSMGNGIPRVELYLNVEDANFYHNKAIMLGAKELSPAKPRGWGDTVAYSMDSDGHVIAFAHKL